MSGEREGGYEVIANQCRSVTLSFSEGAETQSVARIHLASIDTNGIVKLPLTAHACPSPAYAFPYTSISNAVITSPTV